VDVFGLIGKCVAEKYQVESVIGQGGYGVVYAAKHLMLGKQVALKCMKPLGTSAEDSKRATALFLREAEVLFSMTHPGIVRLYDVGTLTVGLHEEVPYAVLELVDGKSLEQEIDARAASSRPFTRQELERIFMGVLEALAFTHAAGIAHRDLKPSNIMLVRGASSPGPSVDGFRTKVLDFGVARFVARETKKSTGITGFTPAYAAPEQWTDGLGEAGPPTDVFAMALTMAEACTLRTVMHAPTPAQIFGVVMARGRKVDLAQRMDLPSSLQGVLDRALEVEPARRYPSAREMLADVMGAFATNTLAPTPTLPPPMATQPGPNAYTATAPLALPLAPSGAPPHAPPSAPSGQSMHPSMTPPPAMPMTPMDAVPARGGTAAWIALIVAGFVAAGGLIGGLLLAKRARAMPAVVVVPAAASVAQAPAAKASHVTLVAMPTGAHISKEQILDSLASSKDDLGRCHRASMVDKGAGVVDVSLFVSIMPNGSVLSVLDLDDLDPLAPREDRWVHRCVWGLASSWKFPSNEKDDISGAVVRVRMRDTAPDTTPLPEPETASYESFWVKEKPREYYPKTLLTMRSYGRVKTLDYKDGCGVCMQYDKKLSCRWVQIDSNGRMALEETDKKSFEGRWGFGDNDKDSGTWKLVPPKAKK